MTLITCQHCSAEIDVATDPRCVVYDPSGATDVMCESCRDIAWHSRQIGPRKLSDVVDPIIEAYRIKRGWRA